MFSVECGKVKLKQFVNYIWEGKYVFIAACEKEKTVSAFCCCCSSFSYIHSSSDFQYHPLLIDSGISM